MKAMPGTGSVSGQQTRLINAHRLTLFLILLVGAVCRLPHVEQPLVDMFSWREASTAMMADNFPPNGWNIFFPEVSWTGPGPSYQGREFQLVSYLAGILSAVFGWSTVWGRLIAGLFGLLSIFAVHRLTAWLWDEPHAHAVALILAVMPGAVAIDSSYLPDPAMLALVTTGAWLLAVHLERGGWTILDVATAATTLGILAKLPGAAVLLPMAAAVLGVHAARRTLFSSGMLRIVAAGTVIIVSVVAYYGWAIHLGTSYPPYHVAGSGYIWDDGLQAALDSRFHLARAYEIAVEWMHGWPILLLAGIGLIAGPPAASRKLVFPLRYFFHIWLVGFAAVYLAAAREITTNPWNAHILAVPAAALAGRGIVALASLDTQGADSWAFRIRAVGMLLAVGLFSTLPGVAAVKTPYARSSYELGRALEDVTQPGDLVVTVARQAGDPVAIYYSRRRGWVFPPGGGARDWSVYTGDPTTALAELEAMRQEGATFFGYVKNARDSQRRLFTEHHRELVTYLDQTAERVADNAELRIYRLSRQSGYSMSQSEETDWGGVPASGQR